MLTKMRDFEVESKKIRMTMHGEAWWSMVSLEGAWWINTENVRKEREEKKIRKEKEERKKWLLRDTSPFALRGFFFMNSQKVLTLIT